MSAATTPSPIVALLERAGEQLEHWARDHRRATLAEHEQGVLGIMRQLMGAVLGAVLTRALALDQPTTARVRASCPGCGQRRKPHARPRPRQFLSVCGAVRIARPYYSCAACRRGWAPADATLEVAPYQALSAGSQQWLTLVGGLQPFRPAAAVLEELTGLGVGAETVRVHTETAGRLLDLCRQAATAQVVATGEPVGPVEPAAGLLVVQTDGVYIRYLDDWHEVKLGLVSGCAVGAPAVADQPARRHRLVGPSYLASRVPAQQFGPQLLAEAARRGALEVVGWEHASGAGPVDLRAPALAVLREVVVLGDGAPWIWNLAAEHFGRRTEIVDWYHASEHVWTLGKALYGAGSAQTRAWVDQALETLTTKGAAKLLPLLDELAPPHDEAAEVLRVERGYFTTNVDRMDYPAFRERGLPIGSGAVESAARHLVQDRLKRAGMRWSEPGAQAVLAVCADLANSHPVRRAC